MEKIIKKFLENVFLFVLLIAILVLVRHSDLPLTANYKIYKKI